MTYLLTVVFIAQFILTQSAMASVQPFTAHMTIGGDDEPPTAPDPFAAMAVAHDQIDLVWGMSVDDTAVGGYRVFRDSVQIATTTLTSFSDIGLAPETAYTYHVDAFDIFYNYSSSSVFATATTLAEVVPPSPPATSTPGTTGNQGVGTVLLFASSVVVVPQQFSARLQWTTNIPTSYVVRWGRTDSYELGSVHGGVFLFDHSTVITELEAATKYYYEIEAVQNLGIRKVVAQGEFTTSGTIPEQAVVNVLGLQAVVEGDSVRLLWKNPARADFSHVRIIRSHLFYPQHVMDGMVIYEGSAESFLDESAFKEKSFWYYTVFVYDKSGRISSGSTVMVVQVRDDEPKDEDDFEVPSAVDLFAMNVALSQGDTVSYLHDPAVFLALEPLFVSIPVSAVPRHLKSIIVTVTHPSRENESSSYLLKINPSGTAYETLLPPTLEAGQSRMTIMLYDYDWATVRTVSNVISFEISKRDVLLPWGMKIFISTAFVIFVVSMAWRLVIVRRRRVE